LDGQPLQIHCKTRISPAVETIIFSSSRWVGLTGTGRLSIKQESLSSAMYTSFPASYCVPQIAFLVFCCIFPFVFLSLLISLLVESLTSMAGFLFIDELVIFTPWNPKGFKSNFLFLICFNLRLCRRGLVRQGRLLEQASSGARTSRSSTGRLKLLLGKGPKIKSKGCFCSLTICQCALITARGGSDGLEGEAKDDEALEPSRETVTLFSWPYNMFNNMFNRYYLGGCRPRKQSHRLCHPIVRNITALPAKRQQICISCLTSKFYQSHTSRKGIGNENPPENLH